MRRGFAAALALLLVLSAIPAAGAESLVPVGRAVGLELETDGVYVTGFPEDQPSTPAQDAGIRNGDRITSVNGKPIADAAQLQTAIAEARGAGLILDVERDGRAMSFLVEPTRAEDGWRIGVLVRDRISGLGTVTFYDPETGFFGALGHGVCGEGASSLVDLRGGTVRVACVTSVRRGCVGAPGELQGRREETCLGQITRNTAQGVFGAVRPGCWPGDPIPVAEPEEVTTGPAEIWSSVEGAEPRCYRVEIEALCFGEERCKNLRLHVTDSRLLEAAGGIVQGMSGSPILQNGKLVGAVTHVLTQDPTRGYGIFLTYMLEAGRTLDAA